jgi:hypothetical protein
MQMRLVRIAACLSQADVQKQMMEELRSKGHTL